ncbi:MAG: signal peptidase I [Thermoplasmata archaeon]|nr:MAG: signal peptidase I [Thermoplasmata archaeon]
MWYLILGLITLIYFIINLILPQYISGIIGSYIIRPILWILLATTVYIVAKQEGKNIWNFNKARHWEIGRNPFEAALLIGGFQISLMIIAGIFFGFGESPYSFTPIGITINIVFVASTLIGTELSRAYFIKKGSLNRKNLTLIIGVVTIFFVMLSIAPSDYTYLLFKDLLPSIKFIGETMIPLLAMNLFACYLAYLGGTKAAIGYMGTLQAFQWFSPILPDLDWGIAALIGTLTPALGFIIIQNSIQLTTPGSRKKRHKTKDPALSWTAIATISVVFVFFSTGFLGVQPTVIYSGSMRPTIDVGDIVIVSKTPSEEIQIGDIIQYRTQNTTLPIVHRVHEIYNKNNTIFFITKGDANDKPDSEPVLSENVMGKVIFDIPKIGWIPIFFKYMISKIITSIQKNKGSDII